MHGVHFGTIQHYLFNFMVGQNLLRHLLRLHFHFQNPVEMRLEFYEVLIPDLYATRPNNSSEFQSKFVHIKFYRKGYKKK